MSNFDIGTLLEFKPPKYLCEKCMALLYQIPTYEDEQKNVYCSYCPVCKVRYISSSPFADYKYYEAGKYLTKNDYAIGFDDPIRHGQRLAAIAHNLNRNVSYYPPMRALLEAIVNARQFIHFTTYGLSQMLYGALKLKAQVIPIRGIAANIYPEFANEIQEYRSESDRLDINIFQRDSPANERIHIPHQKLVVIDGLMAFKGAANLTNDGWRKAASGYDHIEVVTNIQEVVELNNKLFSPIWAKFSNKGDEIDLFDIPF